MSWNDHDHRGEYAADGHTHNFWDLNDAAERHHRDYDLEGDDEKAQWRITALQDELDGLRGELAGALERIRALEADTPQARQLRYEADLAGADAHEFDRHGSGCDCSYCYYDPEEDAP